ncbi:twin-arginine translocation protein TatB [Oleiphilus messinensis]|uniref:Sec-independent protein translocase protein TatB n=1 Tax=Oleiphilus messinensis TaxID=141451 RepID=A0A1Y0I6M9_9GAMM|nr:Sec-independent protein translocase protein TatB [Oleiphilus messinensis]ARU55084.1 twin-arginine translocation protein TatB [Oleiphilus messinensis]
MFDIGFLEILLVGVVALLVLGPERLPHAARTTGKWIGRARRMVRQVTDEIDRELKAEELREKLRQEGDTLGLEKIQGTVQSALDKAKDFDHFVEKDDSVGSVKDSPSAPSSTPANSLVGELSSSTDTANSISQASSQPSSARSSAEQVSSHRN